MSDESRLPVIPFTQVHPDQILSDQLLASLLGTSVDTLQRMRAKGETPPRIRISERRHGTRVRDFQAWLDSRLEGQETR